MYQCHIGIRKVLIIVELLYFSLKTFQFLMGLHFYASLPIYTFVCKIHNLTEYVFVKPCVNFVNWDGKSINHPCRKF